MLPLCVSPCKVGLFHWSKGQVLLKATEIKLYTLYNIPWTVTEASEGTCIMLCTSPYKRFSLSELSHCWNDNNVSMQLKTVQRWESTCERLRRTSHMDKGKPQNKDNNKQTNKQTKQPFLGRRISFQVAFWRQKFNILTTPTFYDYLGSCYR